MSDSADAVARAHRELVRASVAAQGTRGIAERIAGLVGGWLLVLDGSGAPLASIPEGARAHLALVQTELSRFTAGARPTTMSLVIPGESVSIRPVGVAGRIRGFIAIGRANPLDAIERSLVDTATYLLAEDLHRSDELRRAARNNRSAVLHLLLGGHAEVARSTSEILRVPIPDGPVRAALLGVPRRYALELLEAAEEDQALRRIETVIAELRPGRIGIVLPTAEGDVRTLEAILRRVPHGRGAVTDPVEVTDLPAAWRRVRGVFEAASDQPGKLYMARDVSEAGLLRHLTGPDARAWAQAALAPLTALDKGSKVDFAQTLRAFLAHNGQADASAGSLGIHRHTLRYRMTRIADALGRDLDDPTVRAELWFALQLYPDE
ncbi:MULTISPECIES: PucR family transcriptional regulator [Nocardia]|uniref:Sugar diacid regulator n=1 Tax=Nocardia farcinica TaxID=37329 RepID=A0A449H0I3_NOCFR|nr:MULTISPECIES: helix-turn-helix domain-containing protein [Nocardia]MBA4857989.1 helix-turn-helix domain-containing protein [Nocardia farcinica]MBC9819262.1 helix-turn-helix domain-containing protein [Nocardia farcinica]MBF6185690.1 helix-turn-helix domain-containing protein [Nocardia farcinica]MBF6311535.1 helix-turn-helix domain-containing protein [Nocardia farcinica]MBF6360165.1 helix-turn-helix domain-containing protein [Nocardia farcinica]